MITEFDLPCSECGADLVRTQVTAGSEDVTVAECPSCGGRYYPEETLDRLSISTSRDRF